MRMLEESCCENLQLEDAHNEYYRIRSFLACET